MAKTHFLNLRVILAGNSLPESILLVTERTQAKTVSANNIYIYKSILMHLSTVLEASRTKHTTTILPLLLNQPIYVAIGEIDKLNCQLVPVYLSCLDRKADSLRAPISVYALNCQKAKNIQIKRTVEKVSTRCYQTIFTSKTWALGNARLNARILRTIFWFLISCRCTKSLPTWGFLYGVIFSKSYFFVQVLDSSRFQNNNCIRLSSTKLSLCITWAGCEK